MGHDARQLRFCVGDFQYPAVYVNPPAGKREGIDGLVVHHPIGIGEFISRCMRCKPLAKIIQIIIHARVVEHGNLALNVSSGLLPHFNVLLRRKHVPARTQCGALG